MSVTAKLLDCTPDEYHRRPGLSQSIAHTLLTRSPKHAWQQHPLLGGGAKHKDTKSMDRGSIIHRMVLGKGKEFRSLDYDDYRTKKAQEARDEARDAGLIPVLEHEHADATKVANNILVELDDAGVGLFADGCSTEQAIEWTENGVLCRGMMDAYLGNMLGNLHAGARILDLKIVHDASPYHIERSAETYGYAMQAAAYTRAVELLHPELPGRVTFGFIFCEPDPPYAVRVVEPDGMFRQIGKLRWERAVKIWGECERSGVWPGYPATRIGVPKWALNKEELDIDAI